MPTPDVFADLSKTPSPAAPPPSEFFRINPSRSPKQIDQEKAATDLRAIAAGQKPEGPLPPKDFWGKIGHAIGSVPALSVQPSAQPLDWGQWRVACSTITLTCNQAQLS